MARENDQTALWQLCQVMEVSNALKGKTFSITGHLGLARAEIVKIIETAGGKFEERPRWGVNFLITNKDFNQGSTVEKGKSSKMIEAERHGIKLISEARFCKMLIDNDELSQETRTG